MGSVGDADRAADRERSPRLPAVGAGAALWEQLAGDSQSQPLAVVQNSIPNGQATGPLASDPRSQHEERSTAAQSNPLFQMLQKFQAMQAEQMEAFGRLLLESSGGPSLQIAASACPQGQLSSASAAAPRHADTTRRWTPTRSISHES